MGESNQAWATIDVRLHIDWSVLEGGILTGSKWSIFDKG